MAIPISFETDDVPRPMGRILAGTRYTVKVLVGPEGPEALGLRSPSEVSMGVCRKFRYVVSSDDVPKHAPERVRQFPMGRRCFALLSLLAGAGSSLGKQGRAGSLRRRVSDARRPIAWTSLLGLAIVGLTGAWPSEAGGRQGEPPAGASWMTARELPGVDMDHLSEDERDVALEFVRANQCTCGCTLRIAECRILDPLCPEAPRVARAAVLAVSDGRSGDDLRRAVDLASRSRLKLPLAPRPALLGPFLAIDSDGAPRKGASRPAVVLLAFNDFDCPSCVWGAAWANEILESFPDSVQLVFKHLPVSSSSQPMLAARAAVAAGLQGRFWDMHDRLFLHAQARAVEDVTEWARELCLDVERFTRDLEDERVLAVVEEDRDQGFRIGVTQVPTFFVNGRRYSGPWEISSVRPFIEREGQDAARLECRWSLSGDRRSVGERDGR